MCFVFPLEVEGPSRVVGGARLVVGDGMHHGNVTARRKTGEGIRECPSSEEDGSDIAGEALDVLGGGSVLFGSSTQMSGEEWQSFPDGMGYRVKNDAEIVARMHYLNASREPVTVAPTYEWYTIDEAKVTRELAPFGWYYQHFEIPPRSTWTVTSAPCVFKRPMHVVTAMPHMHALGTGFVATFAGGGRDGERFLESKGYDPDDGVMTMFEPAIDLAQGGSEGEVGASFSCSWRNTHDKPIVWGNGDNEMCAVFGYAYPPEAAYSAVASDQACTVLLPP